jgi:acyl-CoA thioesterase
MPDPPPFRDRYKTLWAIGAPPLSRSPEAVTGGWIRLAEPRSLDHLLIAALTDAWMPPVFSRLAERVGVPTVDLTIHFRATVDAAEADEWCLVRFRSQMAADGFVEEDGEVWSRSGRLLAHSRQLAMLL